MWCKNYNYLITIPIIYNAIYKNEYKILCNNVRYKEVLQYNQISDNKEKSS